MNRCELRIRALVLDGAADFAEENADRGAKDDEAGNSHDCNESDDQTVFDEALRLVLLNEKHLLEAPDGVEPDLRRHTTGLAGVSSAHRTIVIPHRGCPSLTLVPVATSRSYFRLG
jgi:hypothetical protein